MKIVKVDAIESTNTFLKEMCRHEFVENFTVIVAKNQTQGKGQMGAAWAVEPGKNLTFSVLVRLDDFRLEDQFYVSKAIAISLKNTLVKFLPNKIAVKWPNDIMADNKKIAGVLIENTVKNQKLSYAVVGVGLNVNQVDFDALPNATSMKNLTNREFDLDHVLHELLDELRLQIQTLEAKNFQSIAKNYLGSLYKYDVPAMFTDYGDNRFMGKICGISSKGKLQIEVENESILEFDLKEVKFL